MSYTAIVATSLNNVIGNNGKIPWHIPSDLKYFKEQTLGKKIIMGRETFINLPCQLSKRDIYVLSRDPDLLVPGVKIINSPNFLDDTDEEVIICGGEKIYDLFAPKIDKILLTLALASLDGDRFFNLLKNRNYQWSVINTSLIPRHEKDSYMTIRMELVKT